MWQKSENESVPRILVSALEGGRKLIHPLRTTEQILLAVYMALFQVELLSKEQSVVRRTSLPVDEWGESMSH